MLSFYKMKRTLFLAFLLSSSFPVLHCETVPVAPYLPAQASAATVNAPITVQYPHEKMVAARGAKNVFLFGKLNLKNATLTVNGLPAEVDKNGAFITYQPVQNGDFTFLLEARSQGQTYQATRTVVVPGAAIKDFTATAQFDPEEVYPQSPVELLPGDVLELSARGTPGAQVTYTVAKLKNAKNVEMKEDVSNPGTYRARYLIDEDEKPRTVPVSYQMRNGPQGSEAKITAPAKIKVLDKENPFTTAEILSPSIKLRKIPVQRENLYPFYRAYGEVLLNGLTNGLYRLQLNDKEYAWLEANKLKITRNKSYRSNFVSSLQSAVQEGRTTLLFNGLKEVPVSVQEFNDRVELTFYYTGGFDENFNFDTTSPIVDNITWTEPAKDTVQFKIHFKKDARLWGHSYRYDKNTFILELMHQPALTPEKGLPLKGARILLDAGHSPKRTVPYDGAVGPSGSLEYEVNLALAETLKPLLEKAGAEVIMTRSGDNYASLTDRYRLALQTGAHVFISLHYNALPETVNPLSRPRGFSVYYNYPHSFKLAEAVYESFTRNVKLPDNGLIANDILFIPRISEMPSILVENAYIILPEQEAFALSQEGRATLANAIYEGVLRFYGVQPPTPAKRRKARF